ncbi:DUF2203 domain-containing protein [Candidatus Woesearchaeota archaeon]|nr:DUF2203 domain-containing protein [Candidatus Woesearchaeota archaeon]
MDKRYYTLTEANKAVAKIKPRLIKIAALMRGLGIIEDVTVSFNDDYQAYVHAITVAEQYYRYSHALYKELHKVLEYGCIVKDARIGLIDFYAQHNGMDIFLCYHLGEEEITSWHEPSAGYQGRKSVSLLQS